MTGHAIGDVERFPPLERIPMVLVTRWLVRRRSRFQGQAVTKIFCKGGILEIFSEETLKRRLAPFEPTDGRLPKIRKATIFQQDFFEKNQRLLRGLPS